MTDLSGIVLSRRASAAAVFVRMHYKGAHTYTQRQINYDERILIIDRSAGIGADIIAKGWEENHWARPTIKDSYFPSEETELILDLLMENDQGTTQTTTQSTTEGAIVGTIVENLSAMQARIVKILWRNPNATAKSVSEEVGIAPRNVQEHFRKLQAQGIIRRIGGDFGGHWEII